MKQHYESPRQTQTDSSFPLLELVMAIAMLLAWPALLLGLLIGFAGKRWQFPLLAWGGLAVLGLGGLWLMCFHIGTIAALHIMIQHIPPLTTWAHLDTLRTFLPYMFPLWLRSVLVTPLF